MLRVLAPRAEPESDGTHSFGRQPPSIRTPTTMRPSPMTRAAYFAFVASQPVNSLDTAPTTMNTAKNPADTELPTTSERRTRTAGRLESSTLRYETR